MQKDAENYLRLGDIKKNILWDMECQQEVCHGVDMGAVFEWEAHCTVDWSAIKDLLASNDDDGTRIEFIEQRQQLVDGELHTWLKCVPVLHIRQPVRVETATTAQKSSWAGLIKGRNTKLDLQIQETLAVDAAIAEAAAKKKATGENNVTVQDMLHANGSGVLKNPHQSVKGTSKEVKQVKKLACHGQQLNTKQTSCDKAVPLGQSVIGNLTEAKNDEELACHGQQLQIVPADASKAVPLNAIDQVKAVLLRGPKTAEIVREQGQLLASCAKAKTEHNVWHTVGRKGKVTPESSVASGSSSRMQPSPPAAPSRSTKRNWRAKMKRMATNAAATAHKTLVACFGAQYEPRQPQGPVGEGKEGTPASTPMDLDQTEANEEELEYEESPADEDEIEHEELVDYEEEEEVAEEVAAATPVATAEQQPKKLKSTVTVPDPANVASYSGALEQREEREQAARTQAAAQRKKPQHTERNWDDMDGLALAREEATLAKLVAEQQRKAQKLAEKLEAVRARAAETQGAANAGERDRTPDRELPQHAQRSNSAARGRGGRNSSSVGRGSADYNPGRGGQSRPQPKGNNQQAAGQRALSRLIQKAVFAHVGQSTKKMLEEMDREEDERPRAKRGRGRSTCKPQQPGRRNPDQSDRGPPPGMRDHDVRANQQSSVTRTGYVTEEVHGNVNDAPDHVDTAHAQRINDQIRGRRSRAIARVRQLDKLKTELQEKMERASQQLVPRDPSLEQQRKRINSEIKRMKLIIDTTAIELGLDHPYEHDVRDCWNLMEDCSDGEDDVNAKRYAGLQATMSSTTNCHAQLIARHALETRKAVATQLGRLLQKREDAIKAASKGKGNPSKRRKQNRSIRALRKKVAILSAELVARPARGAPKAKQSPTAGAKNAGINTAKRWETASKGLGALRETATADTQPSDPCLDRLNKRTFHEKLRELAASRRKRVTFVRHHTTTPITVQTPEAVNDQTLQTTLEDGDATTMNPTEGEANTTALPKAPLIGAQSDSANPTAEETSTQMATTIEVESKPNRVASTIRKWLRLRWPGCQTTEVPPASGVEPEPAVEAKRRAKFKADQQAQAKTNRTWKGHSLPEKVWKGTQYKAWKWLFKQQTPTTTPEPVGEAREDESPEWFNNLGGGTNRREPLLVHSGTQYRDMTTDPQAATLDLSPIGNAAAGPLQRRAERQQGSRGTTPSTPHNPLASWQIGNAAAGQLQPAQTPTLGGSLYGGSRPPPPPDRRRSQTAYTPSQQSIPMQTQMNGEAMEYIRQRYPEIYQQAQDQARSGGVAHRSEAPLGSNQWQTQAETQASNRAMEHVNHGQEAARNAFPHYATTTLDLGNGPTSAGLPNPLTIGYGQQAQLVTGTVGYGHQQQVQAMPQGQPATSVQQTAAANWHHNAPVAQQQAYMPQQQVGAHSASQYAKELLKGAVKKYYDPSQPASAEVKGNVKYTPDLDEFETYIRNHQIMGNLNDQITVNVLIAGCAVNLQDRLRQHMFTWQPGTGSLVDWALKLLREQNPHPPATASNIRIRMQNLTGTRKTFAEFMAQFLQLRTELTTVLKHDEYNNGALIRDFFIPRLSPEVAKQWRLTNMALATANDFAETDWWSSIRSVVSIMGESQMEDDQPRFNGMSSDRPRTAVSSHCYKCGEDGHYGRECPHEKCYKCGEAGHYANACPHSSPRSSSQPRSPYRRDRARSQDRNGDSHRQPKQSDRGRSPASHSRDRDNRRNNSRDNSRDDRRDYRRDDRRDNRRDDRRDDRRDERRSQSHSPGRYNNRTEQRKSEQPWRVDDRQSKERTPQRELPSPGNHNTQNAGSTPGRSVTFQQTTANPSLPAPPSQPSNTAGGSWHATN